MKIYILSIILVFFAKSSFSQIDILTNTQNKYNQDSTLIRKNQIKVKKIFDDSLNTITVFYNKNGLVSKMIFNCEDSIKKYEITFTYDKCNNIAQSISSGKSKSVVTYSYMNCNLLTSINDWDPITNNLTILKFDYYDNGELKIYKYINDSIENKSKYSYVFDTIKINSQQYIYKKEMIDDTTLNIISVRGYNEKKIEFFRKNTYCHTYNDNYTDEVYFFNYLTGKPEVILLHLYGEDFEGTREQHLFYDKNGNLIKRVNYNDNEVISIVKYYYDSKNILLKEITNDPRSKDEDKHIIYYEYEYW